MYLATYLKLNSPDSGHHQMRRCYSSPTAEPQSDPENHSYQDDRAKQTTPGNQTHSVWWDNKHNVEELRGNIIMTIWLNYLVSWSMWHNNYTVLVS